LEMTGDALIRQGRQKEASLAISSDFAVQLFYILNLKVIR